KYLSKRMDGPPLIRKKLPAVRTGRTLPAATVLFQRPPALPRAGRGSEGVFQRLALLKDDAAGRSDGDGLLGAGVDALPLGPLPHFKGAKARDGDLFAVGERPAEGLEHSVHGLVGVLFGHVGVCRNLRGQISLGHKMVPPKITLLFDERPGRFPAPRRTPGMRMCALPLHRGPPAGWNPPRRTASPPPRGLLPAPRRRSVRQPARHGRPGPARPGPLPALSGRRHSAPPAFAASGPASGPAGSPGRCPARRPGSGGPFPYF